MGSEMVPRVTWVWSRLATRFQAGTETVQEHVSGVGRVVRKRTVSTPRPSIVTLGSKAIAANGARMDSKVRWLPPVFSSGT